ncbi:glycosyltransferase, partial [Janibacter melonis]|uniref:glycosyltransferase n=1 Tax=Janibacter melonis TaxID=262209 RepID=UPI001781EB67|nr:glycosyltransferase [Janibacter melonis]
RLVLVGEGPSRHELGARLSEAVASSRRRPNLPPAFLGPRSGDALARAYAALDVFVHTGTKETFGQTLQEAAATGLPVVAPAAGGPLDLVADGVSGALYDPAVPGAFRAAAAPLVGDASLRSRMGRAGAERVADRSWSALTGQLVGHYERVLTGAEELVRSR